MSLYSHSSDLFVRLLYLCCETVIPICCETVMSVCCETVISLCFRTVKSLCCEIVMCLYSHGSDTFVRLFYLSIVSYVCLHIAMIGL
jgi:hypothetical protein